MGYGTARDTVPRGILCRAVWEPFGHAEAVHTRQLAFGLWHRAQGAAEFETDVFFDVLGAFMLTYTHESAIRINVTAIVLCLATIIVRGNLANSLRLLARSVIPAVAAAISTAVFVGVAGRSVGVAMSWHTSLGRIIPLFGVPALLAAITVRVSCASRLPTGHTDWPVALLDELSAATLLWAGGLAAVTACSHTTASYLLLVWVGPPLALAVLASAVGPRFAVLAGTRMRAHTSTYAEHTQALTLRRWFSQARSSAVRSAAFCGRRQGPCCHVAQHAPLVVPRGAPGGVDLGRVLRAAVRPRGHASAC